MRNEAARQETNKECQLCHTVYRERKPMNNMTTYNVGEKATVSVGCTCQEVGHD